MHKHTHLISLQLGLIYINDPLPAPYENILNIFNYISYVILEFPDGEIVGAEIFLHFLLLRHFGLGCFRANVFGFFDDLVVNLVSRQSHGPENERIWLQ